MTNLTSIANTANDASPGLQQALDRRGEVRIPPGHYLLGETLRVPSDTSIHAEPGAVFRLADGVGKHCRSFMITNANPGNGNENISLQGGFWDANNAGNPRGTDYDPFAYSGVAINFTNVKHLTLRDLAVHNPESFFIRVGEVTDFLIEDITVRRLRGGCRVHGLNLNNWRFPKGVGAIRRVTFEDIELAKTEVRPYAKAIVEVSLHIEDLRIERLKRGAATHPEVKTLLIDNRQDLEMELDGQATHVSAADGFVHPAGDIGRLRLRNRD